MNPVRLSIYGHLLAACAEEMGAALGRSASSANIKERRDYSCAVFDDKGRMIAQAAHIPVHLGSMPLSVEAALRRGPAGARVEDVAVQDVPPTGRATGFSVRS
jgi:N-methylhydantoinase B